MSSNSTVFVVDDDRVFLETTCKLLKSAQLSVIACESAHAFLNTFQLGQPGCLLLDVIMPHMSGLELLEELNQRRWTIPTIVMTAHSHVSVAVQAMKLGALDFVEKPFRDKQSLIDLVQRALQTATFAQQQRAEIEEIGRKLATLTEHELYVLNRVVDGLSSKEIAYGMEVSIRTVETQRAKIMKKLEADSIPHLVRMVLRHATAK